MGDRTDSRTDGLRGVRRLATRPILEAGALPGYGPLFNAGLVHHEGRYHLFVRAVREGYRLGEQGGPRFVNYVSDIVVFTSGPRRRSSGHDVHPAGGGRFVAHRCPSRPVG